MEGNNERFEFKAVLFDLNGTLGVEGKVLEDIKELLARLSERYTVVVLSADTFGTLEEELKGLPVRIERVSSGVERPRLPKATPLTSRLATGTTTWRCLRRPSWPSA